MSEPAEVKRHGAAQHYLGSEVRVGDIVPCQECAGGGICARRDGVTHLAYPMLCLACNGSRTQVVREVPGATPSLVDTLTEGLAKIR